MGTKAWGSSILGLVLAGGAGATAQEEQPNAIVHIEGRAVDAETGAPIEHFALQRGRVDRADPSKIAWGFPRIVPNSHTVRDGQPTYSPNPKGEFSDFARLMPGDQDHWDRLRVLADGYEPAMVLDRPPGPADAGRTLVVTVRLNRGKALVGRVLDHAGQPAVGARLALLRPGRGTFRVVDDALGEGSDTGLLDPAITRAVADAEGRFRLPGVGDATHVVVMAPTLHAAVVAVPPAGEPVAIRLPAPTALRIPYAVAGDAPEALLWFAWTGPKDLGNRLGITRNVTVPNGGEAVLRDVPSGEYTLWRRKLLPVGGHPRPVSVEHRTLHVAAGDVTEVAYVRKGPRIAGTVLLPEGGVVRSLYVGIEPVGQPAPNIFQEQWLDIVACDEAGRFRTAAIPPGDYVVHAAGYKGQPRYEPFGRFNTGSTSRARSR
jgi:hypothetical protein